MNCSFESSLLLKVFSLPTLTLQGLGMERGHFKGLSRRSNGTDVNGASGGLSRAMLIVRCILSLLLLIPKLLIRCSCLLYS